MKKSLLLVAILLSITGCNKNTEPVKKENSFGIFLGANNDATNKLLSYENVAIELDEFSSSNIKKIKDNNTSIYAYLSIGSLEKYRDYYEEFKDYTFMDYENWPDERWIDVSQKSWQDHLISEANRLKDLGANGLFMDNFDVYYIVNEEHQCSESFKEGIYQGCLSILENLSKTGLKLLINSGTDFLERMDEENNSLISKIDVYAQECVFSSIIDYDNDIFGTQDKETQDYYFEIINLMKTKSEILLIEYTKDTQLKEQIKAFCKQNQYHYYISEKVNLE